MYEDEVKQLREKRLEDWKIERLAKLEDQKLSYLENYEKQKKETEEAKFVPDYCTPSISFSGYTNAA